MPMLSHAMPDLFYYHDNAALKLPRESRSQKITLEMAQDIFCFFSPLNTGEPQEVARKNPF